MDADLLTQKTFVGDSNNLSAAYSYVQLVSFGQGLSVNPSYQNIVTNDLITGKIGGVTLLGGSQATDAITFKATTGNMSSNTNAFIWNAGNNGATNSMSLTSTGNLTVNGTFISSTGQSQVNDLNSLGTIYGAYQSTSNANQSNFLARGSNTAGGTTTGAFLPSGVSTMAFRINTYGGQTYTPASGTAYSAFLMAATPVTIPGSGTVPFISNLCVLAPSVTNGAGTSTFGCAVYIDGAPSNSTTNYSIYIRTGSLYFGGSLAYYNSIATAGNGTSVIRGIADLTAQTAAKTATTIFTPTATGMFRITVYLQVTTAASTSSILGGTNGVVITYNDGDGNVAQSDTVALFSPTGTVVTNLSTNTTTTNLTGSIEIYAKSGTAIQYAIDYTSVGVTAMQYTAHLRCEDI